MAKNKRRETPEWAWEQKLIDDYYDYRWRQVLDPLYEQMQQWKVGQLGHDGIDQAFTPPTRKIRSYTAFSPTGAIS
jgi:hypothetical protein